MLHFSEKVIILEVICIANKKSMQFCISNFLAKKLNSAMLSLQI
ncbi:hypothetical protein D920_00001 [Enterococcus faecalis 13-SD-W-01]|nr:hypothetical protein D920_00001 [Enterococcus faecalis 13-SD-W-01]